MKNIALILAISAAASAAAQDLSTEVLVDRTVVPAERGASRLGGLSPQLVLPPVTPLSLTPVDYTGLSAITRSYPRLGPAEGALAAEKSPYRGYAGIGYFPTLNIGASAGYRFVDNERMSLGASLQFDGESFKPVKDVDTKQQSWAGRLGVGFGYKVNDASTISASVAYEYLSQSTLTWQSTGTSAGRINLGWRSRAGIVDYSVGASLGFESNGDAKPALIGSTIEGMTLDGLGQQQYKVDAQASAAFMENSRAGLALEADFVHTSGLAADAEATLGTVGVMPFYQLSTGNLTARVGVKVDFAAGGEGSVSVAPEINLQWDAAELASVWARATGGEVMNPFSAVRQLCQYQIFTTAFGRSRIPVKVEAGLNVGPFSGFTAGIYGGYASAKEWLMLDSRYIQPFAARDISGWHAGVRMGYEHRYFDVSASAEAAPSAYDRRWVDFADGAKYIVNAAATVHPIDRLDIEVGYELRSHRAAFSAPDVKTDLGNVSDLRAGAAFRVTPAFTVFARAENLLGHRHLQFPLVYSQKQTGLVGVSVKF